MKFTKMIVAAIAISAISAMADGQTPTRKKGVVQQANQNISGQGYGMAGCGLGSIAFGSESGTVQIFAATTNGTSGSQTFGISSGTSNCDTDSNGHASAQAFIFANREALEKDIARGNGETLSSFSTVLGCQDSNVLGQKLKKDYKKIFSSENVGTGDVVNSIMNDVRIDPSLAANCASIS